MVQKTATIINKAGIHVRPSGLIMQETGEYPGEITLTTQEQSITLNSIMTLLSLGLMEGDQVDISVEGPDEEHMCNKLAELLGTNFDFPRK